MHGAKKSEYQALAAEIWLQSVQVVEDEASKATCRRSATRRSSAMCRF